MSYTFKDEEGNIIPKIARCHICGIKSNTSTIPSKIRYKFKLIVIWFCSDEHKIEWMNGNNITDDQLTEIVAEEKS